MSTVWRPADLNKAMLLWHIRQQGDARKIERRAAALLVLGLCTACGHRAGGTAIPPQTAIAAGVPMAPPPPGADAGAPGAAGAGCLTSGDGYLRANLGGTIEAHIDWPNSGTLCEGESRATPPGVRLSFRRDPGGNPDLLLVFGLTGVKPGAAGHEIAANVTVIVQGTAGIYGTQGDSRCTVDSFWQLPLQTKDTYRIEARGFCTQPAHAVRGAGDVLVSTFEFAGPVTYVSNGDND